MMTRNPDILFITEYMKNVLYFATVRQGKLLKSTPDIHYFCIDNELLYENYYSDFGPLNLGCVYKYCKALNEKLVIYQNKQHIVHYTSIDPKRKANAAFLIGCYGVIYMNLSPKEAMKPLTIHGQTYRPFQDATQGDSIYTITLMDCLHAIQKAREVGFFDFDDFDYEEYDRLDKIQGGDLNWIVPGKFLAFIGPVDYRVSLYHPPEMYIGYFLENHVKIVIRLNKRMYDGNVFNNAGIIHYDLFFPDGSCPPRHILFKFLQISEESDGGVAVHCKAGLGRTGSLIGSYLIKHYRMTAHEAIGWMRICRPGSVIGHQQNWLEQLEPWLIKQGNFYRKRTFQDTDKFPIHEYGVYSIAEKSQKQKPVVLSKSPSTPPPINRLTRSEIAPPLRPQASKIREAPNKITSKQKEQSEWRLKSPKLHGNQNYTPLLAPTPPAFLMAHRESQEHTNSAGSQRGFAAGEPRSPRTTSTTRPLSPMSPLRSPSKVTDITKLQVQRNKEKVTEHQYQPSNPRNFNAYPQVLPNPTYKSPGPAAKNTLTKTNLYKAQKEKQLSSTLTITPRSQYRPSACFQNDERPQAVPNTSSNFSTIPRDSTQPLHRRRLGRSPSPSPTPSPTRIDRTRATNTMPTDKYLQRDSKTALREALSRLRLLSPARDGSVGAASLGAASLGARRDAPVPMHAHLHAPSTHSDERPLATQGDLLNSIKFQRRFRESMNVDKKPLAPFTDRIARPLPVVSYYRTSRENNEYSDAQDKTKSNISKGLFNQPTIRPTSPKGRTRQSHINKQHFF